MMSTITAITEMATILSMQALDHIERSEHKLGKCARKTTQSRLPHALCLQAPGGYFGGQPSHSGCEVACKSRRCSKDSTADGNQNQRVFDQILAGLFTVQLLDELQQFHFSLLVGVKYRPCFPLHLLQEIRSEVRAAFPSAGGEPITRRDLSVDMSLRR